MAAVYNEPGPHPVEIEINQLFDQIVFSVNQRRATVLSSFRELDKEIIAKPETRVKMIEELTSIKRETESRLQANDLHSLQEKLLGKIKAELEKAKAPIIASTIEFHSEDLISLNRMISNVGDVVEVFLPDTDKVSSTDRPQGDPPAPAGPTQGGDRPSDPSNLNT